MKKILFFAIALVAGVLAFTSCEGNNPEITGKEYHYDAELTLNDAVGTTYPFQLYFTVNEKNEVSMRWENLKYDGKSVDLFYTGKCEKLEEEVYILYVEEKMRLKDGTWFDEFGTVRAHFDFGANVDFVSSDAHFIYDNENVMAWISGTLVKE